MDTDTPEFKAWFNRGTFDPRILYQDKKNKTAAERASIQFLPDETLIAAKRVAVLIACDDYRRPQFDDLNWRRTGWRDEVLQPPDQVVNRCVQGEIGDPAERWKIALRIW